VIWPLLLLWGDRFGRFVLPGTLQGVLCGIYYSVLTKNGKIFWPYGDGPGDKSEQQQVENMRDEIVDCMKPGNAQPRSIINLKDLHQRLLTKERTTLLWIPSFL
jgi:hypothetical protein